MLLEKLCNGRLPALVMFDLDGTLVDSVPDLAAAVDQMLEALDREPAGENQVREWVGNGAAMLVRRALCGGRDDGPEVDAMQDGDIAEPLALFLKFYSDNCADRTRLYPGVRECLQQLQDQGVKTAVVTNKPEQFVVPILNALGVGEGIDLVVGGDTLAQKKPHPMPLEHCLQHFGLSANDALMVGDSRHDIHAAQAAGVAVAAVTYGYSHGEPVADCGPDAVINCVMELLAPFS